MIIDRPLNILTLATLFPNETAPNFGIFVERQTSELANRDGANVAVINPIGLPPWPLNRMERYAAVSTLEEEEQWKGLRVHRPRFRLIPKFGGARNPSRIVDAIWPLVNDLHSSAPFDLIDAEFFYPDGPAAMALGQRLGIPFTIKARGADIHHWGNETACREQILEAAGKAAKLLAVSHALKSDMVAMGMDEDKIEVHYTGLDQDKFTPVDRAQIKQKHGLSGPVFICAGALIPRKNQALIIEAMSAFPDATLLLAGKGEEEANYRALADRLGVAQQVQFLGSVAHEVLPELVAASDIAILVSKSEGLANAWVEALSCGTPVIISEAGGARELVRSDIAGRIVDQNSDAIIEAVRSILDSPPNSQAVRKTVSHFSWKNNGDQLLKVFAGIAEKA